jgi:hypothetical protein
MTGILDAAEHPQWLLPPGDDYCHRVTTQLQLINIIIIIKYNQGRIYARTTEARAQGGILKNIEIEIWYAKKKRLSTSEKFKGDVYWKHYNVLSFASFCVVFAYT